MKSKIIPLTKHEIQSGCDRQKHAEGLILQLPESHNGRNTWLMNYGVGAEAVELRKKRGLLFHPNKRASESRNEQLKRNAENGN